MTGVNPAKHGLFWFYERQADSYAFRYLNGSNLQAPTFWDILSAAGRRVGVINVPMTFPAHPTNGFIIAGLDAPSEESPDLAYPAGLYREVHQNIGRYLIDTNILGYARRGRYGQALKATQQVIAVRAATTSYLMQRKPWDVFVVVFTALDRVQHTFWHLMDPDHPEHDPHQAKQYGDAIYQCYAQLDSVIGDLIAQAGADADVMIVSDHGFGFNQRGYHFLRPWLTRLGLLHPIESSGIRGKTSQLPTAILREIAAVADGLIPKRLRRRLMRLLPGGRAGLVKELHQVHCDWSRTKAYVDYIRPGIWINLRGREPQGIVDPGEEYEALRDNLIDQLMDCRDLATGEPIVRAVRRKEEVYAGPHLYKGPDLAIEWNYDIIVKGLRYRDGAGQEIIIEEEADIVERRGVSGDHRPEGILVAAGPHIKPGREIKDAHIIDIAPTVLRLMGISAPAYMDGKVLEETLKLDPLEATAHSDISTIQEMYRWLGTAEESLRFSDEESLMVEERLRGLGYIE
jgi:predicted AlkP superfamily phosphohydrolase/phosphomutase